MAPGKAPCRRRSSDSGVEPDRGPLLRDRGQRAALSQKKKEQRIALFLSDFDQQAKEHIQEMKKELDSLLQTAEKALAVELLTMPAAVRKMKRKDVLGESAWPCAGVRYGRTPANSVLFTKRFALSAPSFKQISNLCFPCLANTFLVKVTTIVEYEDATSAKNSSAKKITKKVSLFCFYSKNLRT
ncbi:BORE2 protein, partial [Spelaeornis formosus]|nr:BORE2 protein [Elachura formosa]